MGPPISLPYRENFGENIPSHWPPLDLLLYTDSEVSKPQQYGRAVISVADQEVRQPAIVSPVLASAPISG